MPRRTARRQQVVLFDYAASRAGRAPVGQLGDYAGRLLTDGYEGYAEIERRMGSPMRAAGRMPDASSSRSRKYSPKAKPAKWPGCSARSASCTAWKNRSMPLNLTHATCCRNRRTAHLSIISAPDSTSHWPRYCPKVCWVKPCNYLNNQWPRLTRFLDHDLIPLWTTIRQRTLSNRSWWGVKTDCSATHRAALLPAQRSIPPKPMASRPATTYSTSTMLISTSCCPGSGKRHYRSKRNLPRCG